MSVCGEPVESDGDVPCIHVRYVRGQVDAVEHVQYGIEEERVPWALLAGTNRDALALAREAATDSRLKVGIGIAATGAVVLHHGRLPADEPLFALDEATTEQARRVGTNAARLAKRLPLKPIAPV